MNDRLRCAWCGLQLSAVELIEHRSLKYMERWGWHHECFDADDIASRHLPWPVRRSAISLRGNGRIGTISPEALETPTP